MECVKESFSRGGVGAEQDLEHRFARGGALVVVKDAIRYEHRRVLGRQVLEPQTHLVTQQRPDGRDEPE